MGGNALKNIVTRRYSKDEYFAYHDKIRQDMFSIFGLDVVQLIPAYKSKDSFGDMDLVFIPEVISMSSHYFGEFTAINDPLQMIIDYYGLSKDRYSRNGNVFSFAPHDFQIDLIRVDYQHASAAVAYFSYNDLSNLLGRLTHKLGIKLGHRGLSMVLRSPSDSSKILGEIELSSNYYDALNILGLDVIKYSEGFDTLEDIFEYVASSKFFNGDIFLLDNRNHISRVRDKKRPTYNKFLEWIEEAGPKNNFIFDNAKSLGGHGIREPFFSDIILKRFPEVQDKIIDLIKEDLVTIRFKSFFNGNVVGNMSGLQGKELGVFMSMVHFSHLERHMVNAEMVRAKVEDAIKQND